MRERVSQRIGRIPVILVCPHGANDNNTAIVTEETAESLDCYSLINRGFDRGSTVDVDADIADCNRVSHIQQDVVCDEFLKPLISFKTQCMTKLFGIAPNYMGRPGITGKKVLILYLHGAGNIVHKIANEPVGIIVGYGLGRKKNSPTCEQWRKNLFVDLFRNYCNDGDAFEGKGGGNYAGRGADNVNQYFRKHDRDHWVDTMQLEFPWSRRKTKDLAKLTAELLSTVVSDMIKHDEYDPIPQPKFI